MRAALRARGTFVLPDGVPLARLEVRYQFFSGESFVRVLHTLTWMVKDVAVGARDYALQIKPSLGDGGVIRVGESDFTDAHTSVNAGGAMTARQDDAEHVAIHRDGKLIKEGAHLGGWFAVEDGDGRGVGVALREAWQMFPKTFAVRDGVMRVEFWPSDGPRMGFREQDIMPPDFFNNAAY